MKMFKYEFVEFIPKFPEESTIYISLKFCTAVHNCACGCGNKVVTKISPIDWKIIFRGSSISLYPSIGNWNFDCRSHYWITENKIRWARKWSDKKIEKGRLIERHEREEYYKEKEPDSIWDFIRRC